MTTLTGLFPDPDALLAFAPEELAPVVLRLAHEHIENGLIHPAIVDSQIDSSLDDAKGYPGFRKEEVRLALREAWNWLRVQGFVVPAEGYNGKNGYLELSRRGKELAASGDLASIARAAGFPKALLHPTIAEAVSGHLARGDLVAAVFFSMRAVEEAVRTAAGLSATDVGVALMRKAFDKKDGPLTDTTQPEAEREALAHLFAGAIGSYKNPHSHRTVSLQDHSEAQEIVVLASHLLRIIDARRVSRGTPR